MNILKTRLVIKTTETMLSCVQLEVGSPVIRGMVTERAKGTAPCTIPPKKIRQYSYMFKRQFSFFVKSHPIKLTKKTFITLPTNRVRKVKPSKAAEKLSLLFPSTIEVKDCTLKI